MQYRKPVALALSVNQQWLPVEPHGEDRLDTQRRLESVRPCLAGCPFADNYPERCLAARDKVDRVQVGESPNWVPLERSKSKETILKQGVPQGSVQLPLLFLFIDDK